MSRVKPPTPIVIKAPKIDATLLQAAYDWMPVDKNVSFRMAYSWYAANQVKLMFGGLTPEDQKRFERGRKSRELGDRGTTEHEMHAGWLTGLRMFEKAWEKHSLPTADNALKATSAPQHVVSLKTVLDALAAYNTLGVTFGLTVNLERETEGKTILLPYNEALNLVGQSPLTTLLNEAIGVARLIATGYDEQGNPRLNGALFISTLESIHKLIVEWAEKTSLNVAQAVGAVPTVKKAPKAAAAPAASGSTPTQRAPRSNVPGAVDPFNVFTPGTMKAALAALLSDKQWHTIAEMEALCKQHSIDPKWNVPDTFYYLKKKGGVKIERYRDRVRVL